MFQLLIIINVLLLINFINYQLVAYLFGTKTRWRQFGIYFTVLCIAELLLLMLYLWGDWRDENNQFVIVILRLMALLKFRVFLLPFIFGAMAAYVRYWFDKRNDRLQGKDR